MKTIYVDPVSVDLNGVSLGTIQSVMINGNIEIFGTSLNVWTSMQSNGIQIASKSLQVTAGCTESGVDWAVVEADILSQLGLVKAKSQTPPTGSMMP